MTWCHCVFLHTLDSGPCVLKMLGSSVLSIILPGSRSLWPPLSDRCAFGPCRSADTRSLVFPMMLYNQPSLQKQINQQYKLRWVKFTDGVTNKCHCKLFMTRKYILFLKTPSHLQQNDSSLKDALKCERWINRESCSWIHILTFKDLGKVGFIFAHSDLW